MGEEDAVAVTLARLEGKIDTNFAVIRGDLSSQRAQVEDHEKRLRNLQENTPTRSELARLDAAVSELNRWRWKLIGFFSAISAVVAVVATVLTTVIEQALSSH